MPRSFLLVLALLIAAASIAGWFFTHHQNIPARVVYASLPAVVLECALYAALAFPALRGRLKLWPMALAAALPFAFYSLPTGVFSLRSFAAITAGAVFVILWFQIFGCRPISSLGFLMLMAAPLVLKWFPLFYARPHEDLRLDFLGQLLWIRIGVLTVLAERPQPGVGFGFWPRAAEWSTGLRWFAIAAPVVLPLVMLLGFAKPAWPVTPWWQTALIAAGTFFGIFWVVALSEEFFFRGLLQQWIEEWTGQAALALIAAAALFGSVHLGFRQFPNWRFALIAGIAGVFYGMAFRRGAGVRAAMVTHALMVTVWRVCFQ